MARKLVTQEELVDILNRELAKLPECAGVRVSHLPDKLRVDETGCNWSRDVVLGGPLGGPQACTESAAVIVSRLAAEYNLR